MKKMVMTILLGAVLLFSACSNGGATNVDTKKLADDLLNNITYADQLAEVDSAMTQSTFGYQAEDVVASVHYASSGATAEEIAVFECKDAEATNRVKETVEKHLQEYKDGFSDYLPSEVPKLEKAVVITSGNYIVYSVSDDDAKAKEIIDGYLK